MIDDAPRTKERDVRTRNATVLLRTYLRDLLQRPPTEVGNFFGPDQLYTSRTKMGIFFTNVFASAGVLGAYQDGQEDGNYCSL